jgi:hypothetical protein
VEDFIDAHYSAIRCAVFHSKASAGQALRPGSLADQDRVFHQLIAVQAIVEGLLKTLFSVNLATSGVTYSGFNTMLEQAASTSGLLISVTEFPTIEEILAKTVDEQSTSLAPVKFDGANKNSNDEWLLRSEIKPSALPFSKVGCLRLLVRPSNDVFQQMLISKLNRSSLYTDIDIADVIKFVVIVRCILRNQQSPKTGFHY